MGSDSRVSSSLRLLYNTYMRPYNFLFDFTSLFVTGYVSDKKLTLSFSKKDYYEIASVSSMT